MARCFVSTTILASVFFGAVSAAHAQPVVPAPSSSSRQEIVVEGKKLEPVIQHFISSMTQGRPTDQLGRWTQEICPTIFGIDPAQASFMEDRIVALANEVGLRKGGNHCTTSLAIIVTANPGNFAYRLARRYPTTLSTDGYSRLVSFVDTTNPVRWITISDECGGGCGLPNSRITKPTAPTFINMIIVVDANRLSGYSLGELSDYVALVGLTNPPVQAARPPNSIMSMFDAAQPANSSFELTDFDRTFIAGLYRTSPHSSGSSQRSSILTGMTRAANSDH